MESGRRKNLYGWSRAELGRLVEELGLPPYRGRQLFRHLYRRSVSDFAEMTDLGAGLRETLASRFEIRRPQVVGREQSGGGTVRLLLEFDDGARVDAVAIPTRRKAAGGRSGRARSGRGATAGGPGDREDLTVCVSTQVGCPLACTFCRSGAIRFARNLTPGEIVSQVLFAEREVPGGPRPRRRNVVFMGMGEPLLNTDAVLASLELLTDAEGFGISPRRITVSTVGLPDGMRRLAAEAPRVGIAVSLHAGEDRTRVRFMPIGRKHGMDEIFGVLADLPRRRGRRITLEYVLLGGENDDLASARALIARLLSLSKKGIRARVNLIVFNPWRDPAPGPPHRPGTEADAERFLAVVAAAGYRVTLRRSRGRDVGAACGQLAATPV